MGNKSIATIHISGAGVVSVDSSQMFSSAKGKKQLDALKKIHEHRKKRDKKVNLSNARVTSQTSSQG